MAVVATLLSALVAEACKGYGLKKSELTRIEKDTLDFLRQRLAGMLTTEGSPMTASMFRDIKAGLPVEADHVIGDLVARADAAKIPVPKLRIAYIHLKAYEKQRSA
mgnify:CR=1 FL=1